MKTELTISESQKLISLGVDPKLASGFDYNIRAELFTLTDILAILPKEIEVNKKFTVELIFYWNKISKWWGAYYDNLGEVMKAPQLIDALYQLLIWCINNGHYNP